MSDLNPFHTGERVRITIDATVTWSDSGEIEYEYRSQLGTVEGKAALDSDAVKVERIVPAEWPPRPGDLWRDGDGDLWLCRTYTADGIEKQSLICSKSIPGKRSLLGGGLGEDRVHQQYGPLTLVHREEAP